MARRVSDHGRVSRSRAGLLVFLAGALPVVVTMGGLAVLVILAFRAVRRRATASPPAGGAG